MSEDYTAAQYLHERLLHVAKLMKITSLGALGLSWEQMPPHYHALLMVVADELSMRFFGKVEDGEQSGFFVENGFGIVSKQPFLTISLNGRKLAQMDIESAHNLALNLLTGAEAATQDGFMITFYREMGLEDEKIAGIVREFRSYRETRFAELSEPSPKED